jgi:hypothetical protein
MSTWYEVWGQEPDDEEPRLLMKLLTREVAEEVAQEFRDEGAAEVCVKVTEE